MHYLLQNRQVLLADPVQYMRKYKAVKLDVRRVSVLNSTPCKMWTGYRQLKIKSKLSYENYTCLCILSMCVSLSMYVPIHPSVRVHSYMGVGYVSEFTLVYLSTCMWA